MRQAGEQAAYDAGVPGLHAELIRLLGPAEVPDQLRAERPEPLRRDRAPGRDAGGRAGRQRGRCQEGRPAARHRQGGRPRGRGAPRPDRRRDRRAVRGVARSCATAIAAHHQEVEQESIEATVVQIADAISASRPGARGEALDSYIKRLDDLQQIALASPASSAATRSRPDARSGSSSRPTEIDDVRLSRASPATWCARSRSSSSTPGQIKVTVIRETRAVDYAR